MNRLPRTLPIEAGKVRIRRFRVGDLKAFQAYRRDPDVGRWQSWDIMDDARAAGFIAHVAAAPFPPAGEWMQLAIARSGGDDLVGDIGLFVNDEGAEAEIGFTLAAEAQGQGLAAAAVRAMIGFLFETTELGRIVGITDAKNAPSIRLMERLGMEKIATEEAIFKGEPCIEITYQARRGRWSGVAI